MLDEALTAIASAAGAEVVKAMATDAWSATRAAIVRAFKRAGAEPEKALIEDADAIARAPDTEREQLRRDLAPVWADRLTALLAGCPDRRRAEVAAELAGVAGGLARTQSVDRSWAGRDINQVGSVGGDFSTGGGRGR